MSKISAPIVGFCAWSGTGKTTLLAQLIPILVAQGLRIAVVKHAHHDFDIDHPGKDSFELRKAGASQMLITSRKRMAVITEFEQHRAEPSLYDALERINMQESDLVLVEGFKHEPIKKIELHRAELKKPLMFPDDPNIIASASDQAIIENRSTLPQLNLNKPQQIAQFIVDNILATESSLTSSGVCLP